MLSNSIKNSIVSVNQSSFLAIMAVVELANTKQFTNAKEAVSDYFKVLNETYTLKGSVRISIDMVKSVFKSGFVPTFEEMVDVSMKASMEAEKLYHAAKEVDRAATRRAWFSGLYEVVRPCLVAANGSKLPTMLDITRLKTQSQIVNNKLDFETLSYAKDLFTDIYSYCDQMAPHLVGNWNMSNDDMLKFTNSIRNIAAKVEDLEFSKSDKE